MKNLCIINHEPLSIYVKKGYSMRSMHTNYNPNDYFDNVFILAINDTDWPISNSVKVIGLKPENITNQIVDFCKDKNICALRIFEAFPYHKEGLKAKIILDIPC